MSLTRFFIKKPLWVSLVTVVGIVLAGLAVHGQYREKEALKIKAAARLELGKAQDLRALLSTEKRNEAVWFVQTQAVQDFLAKHPQGELLDEFPDTRLILAENYLALEHWEEAGDLLAKVRALAGEEKHALRVCQAHLLMAEATAAFPHLADFTQVAISAAEKSLADAGQAEAVALRRLQQRVAAVRANMARHAAQSAWRLEEERLISVNKQAQGNAKRLSTQLQKEMKQAEESAAAELQKATEANDPAAVQAAAKVKDGLVQKFAETLARREQELRDSIVRDFLPSEALQKARNAWIAACVKALDLAEADTSSLLDAKTRLLEAYTQPEHTKEGELLVDSLKASVRQKVTADPDNYASKKLAAMALLRIAEFRWLTSQEKTGEERKTALAAAERYCREALELIKGRETGTGFQLSAVLAGIMEDTGRRKEALLQNPAAQAPESQTDLVLRLLAREQQKISIHRNAKKPEDHLAVKDAAVKLANAARTWHQTRLSSALTGQRSQLVASQAATLAALCSDSPETKAWAKVLDK